jgi:hypothetical protein
MKLAVASQSKLCDRCFQSSLFSIAEVNMSRKLALLVLTTVIALASDRSYAGFRHHSSVCYCATCQTVYKAGDASSDLQVHIRGPNHNVLEVYFNENLERYQVPAKIDLCRYGKVLLAKRNDLGTFAVTYGTAGFTAFGWKGNKIIPLTVGRNEYPPTGADPNPHVVQIDIDPTYPICLEWVTNRILRITHGRQYLKEYIIRFDGDSKPWKLLYSGPTDGP